MMRLVRTLSILLLAVALVTLVLAACGDSKEPPPPPPAVAPIATPIPTPAPPPTATPTPAPTFTPTPAPVTWSALDLMKLSFDRMQDMSSFRAEVAVETEVLGQSVSLVTEMERADGGEVYMRVELESPDGEQVTEMVLARPHVYMKLPNMGWLRIAIEELADVSGLSEEAFDLDAFASIFPAEDVPWDLYEVESLGRERVDGVQTERLKIRFDFKEVLGRLDEATRERLFESTLSGVTEDVLGQVEFGAMEV